MKALVLSGGGSKGSFQAGALRKIYRLYDASGYDFIAGVSVGALNASGLAMFSKERFDEGLSFMEDLWTQNVSTSSVWKRWFPFGKLHSLWKTSMYDSRPLRSLIDKMLDLSRLRTSDVDVSIGAVCLDTGEHRYVGKDDERYVDWLIASSSYPIFLAPVELDGKLWSDGGLRSVTPLSEAIRAGAEEIYVVLTYDPREVSRWSSKHRSAVPDQVIRALELMNEEICIRDVKVAMEKNRLAAAGDRRYRNVRIRVFCPDGGLPFDSLSFEPDEMRAMLTLGSERAKLLYESGDW